MLGMVSCIDFSLFGLFLVVSLDAVWCGGESYRYKRASHFDVELFPFWWPPALDFSATSSAGPPLLLTVVRAEIALVGVQLPELVVLAVS